MATVMGSIWWLPGDFAGYLKLPKAIVAQAAQVKQKEFPSLSEAEELLNTMPSKSLVDLRARAIFALAFSCKRTNVRFCEPFNKRSFLEQLCEYGK